MSDDLEVSEGGAEDSLTRERVEERVADWQARLAGLFGQVGVWAKGAGWRVDDSTTIPLHEELMQKFGVPATQQPMLRVENEQGYALFKPKGLWVIGANGRIDLYTSKGSFIIVDLAEYRGSPKWTIFRATHRREGDPFKPELLGDLV